MFLTLFSGLNQVQAQNFELKPLPDETDNNSNPNLPRSRSDLTLSFSSIVKQVSPAVVNIYASRVVERRATMPFQDPFFQQFFGNALNLGRRQKQIENSLGSGVIVNNNMGLIITNNHVIKDSSEIRVVLQDKREFDANVITQDERLDLAILKITSPPQGLPIAKLGNPDILEVGDLVLAIGNPFGVGQTVTSGIISGLARNGVEISDTEYFIQTDAAINPGNSGGALVAMNGDVIGINTAIFSKSGGSHGIGFAVPANLAQLMVDHAQKGTKLARPWLGFQGKPVDFELSSALGLDRPIGVFIDKINEQSPAYQNGLRQGDVILMVNQHPLSAMTELNYRALLSGVGKSLEFDVLRKSNIIKLKSPLISPPQIPSPEPIKAINNSPLTGSELINLSPATAIAMELPDDLDGVVIANIIKNSPANRLGFQVGDIIRSYNSQQIADTKQLSDAMQSPNIKGDIWQMEIERNGKISKVEFRQILSKS